MNRSHATSIRLLFTAFLQIATAAFPTPEMHLHGLFTDNMVLQRDMPVTVYGEVDDRMEVTVEIIGPNAEVTTCNGWWPVTLPAMKAGGPYTITIKGAYTLTLHNVLVGDVWLCTGQSNMASTLASYKGEKYAPYQDLFADSETYANDRIRLFKVAQGAADTPQSDVKAPADFGPAWRPCDPKSANLFSATGYYFGRNLQKDLDVPIGLIYSTVGGTTAESWVAPYVIRSRQEFQSILDSYQAALARYPQAEADYQKKLAAFQARRKAGDKTATKAPPAPMGPEALKRPSGLYHFMIAPLQEFRIKGAIWYQGESNAGRAAQYRTLFPALIESWRTYWGEGDFPFLFVQLASYHQAAEEPEDPEWAYLREAQTMTLALPNTAMAVAIDGGLQNNVHPPYKPTVGERLALGALKVAYGKDIVYSGPACKKMTVQGNQAVVEFDNVGSALVAKEVDLDGHHLAGGELKGFAICGEDKKFQWANAVIKDNTVVVSNPEIQKPVAVRYAWADFPLCNLYNKEELPAVPFRTDEFEQGADNKVSGIAVGKPFVCSQANGLNKDGLWAGLTDGDAADSNKTSFSTGAAMTFSKQVTVDLQGKFTVNAIRVYNSSFGGTKTVEVQVSGDGEKFETLGKTEFKNYDPAAYELTGLNAKGVAFVRLVFPDVHETSLQHKANG
ncbi:MAG: sialate O-acetylesterase [Candidatus Sumerlaeota bacterium]|nr:sialate O-acetylesterase [Candidatus Sumerlaeota bacterium]